MTKRHKLLTTTLLTTLVGASYGLWGTAQGFLAEASPSVDKQRNAVSVITTTLEAQNAYQVRRQFTGEFMPTRESDLSFQLAGQIDKLFVNDGDSVEEKQVLATLDTRRIQAERARLVAEKQQASAVLDELNNGSRQEDIDAAIAEVNELKSERELRHNRFLRSKSLFKRGAITQDELDQAEALWKSQEARVSAAEARRDQLVAGPRAEKVKAQQAMVDALQAAIDEIDVRLEDSVLKAPYKGTISSRLLDEGSVVTAGQKVFQLVEDEKLEFSVGMPVEMIEALSPEKTYEVRLGQRKATVKYDRKLPSLNRSTRTQTVVFRVDDSTQAVPGETGEIALTETIPQRGYWIPHTALKQGIQGLWTCYVVADDPHHKSGTRIESRDLDVRHLESDRAFVTGTISAGEQIVSSGLHRLVNHQPVQLDTQHKSTRSIIATDSSKKASL